MFRAICMKQYEHFEPDEIVNVFFSFGKVHIMRIKGLKLSLNLTLTQFEKFFMILRNTYVVEKPPIKKRFRRPKPDYLRVEFKDIPDSLLILLYKKVFSYLERSKQLNVDIIQTFNYSIVSTLEKLEFLYNTLPEAQFIEAVEDAEQVFKGIYETAQSIENEQLSSEENYQQLLENFKQENQILGQFFKEMGSRDKE